MQDLVIYVTLQLMKKLVKAVEDYCFFQPSPKPYSRAGQQQWRDKPSPQNPLTHIIKQGCNI